MNFTPWSGSNFRAAVSSPTFPSPIRSVRGRPRFWYFLATEITKRRLRLTSSCIASWSPARTFRASAISSFWVRRGVFDTSWRYWSRISRSCSWDPRPASRPRRRPRFLAGFAFAWGAGGRAGATAAAATARAAARGFARAGEVVFFRRMCLGISIVPNRPVIPDTGRKVRARAQKRLTPLQRPDKMPCSRRNVFCGAQYNGGVAQLGERVNGIHEVRGSIPLASTERAARAARAAEGGRAGGGGGTQKPTERLNWPTHAGIAQLVEHNLAKVGVAGSSPVSRSPWRRGVEQSGSSPGS